MTHVDEIDRVWRDGLQSLAVGTASQPDPGNRVAARLRARRRTQHAITAATAVVFVVVVAIGAGLAFHHGEPKARVAGAPPVVVDVVDAPGGQLRIDFPGRPASGAPPQITLPAGDLEFELHGRSDGHVLVLDGESGFTAAFTNAPETIVKNVHLEPGVYRLHCTLPGHAEAGEEMLLLVR